MLERDSDRGTRESGQSRVAIQCTCTWKPHPHEHKGVAPDNWNWDKTQAIWAEEEKLNPIKTKRFEFARYKWQHLVPKAKK